MRVYIIGAGPGDPKLITVRGAELIARCPVILYAGSLVPREIFAGARPDARIIDSAPLSLEEIIAVLAEAHAAGQDVARVHTGDPSIFGAIAEQTRQLDQLGIEYEFIPGVSSFTAAAAALKQELTLPELSQTIILSRVEGRTPVPEGQQLVDLARHRATLVLFLSVNMLDKITGQLAPAYGADCPVAVVYRATWPDQKIVRGTLADISEKVLSAGISKQAIILVGRVLGATDFADSRLYAAEFEHGFRPARATADESAGPGKVAPAKSRTSQPGILVVYTGDGKGKTTAAMGLVTRALGRGLPAAVVQFIKGKWKTGERMFAEALPNLTFLVMGLGFTRDSEDLSRDQRAAEQAWQTAKSLILDGEYFVVVLDEISHAINYGFVPLDDVVQTLAARPAEVNVVLTGRNMPAGIIDAADLVTEMKNVKHPFDKGAKALMGIDF